MSEQPLITIITVVHDLIKAGREQYFRQCLESVHNQTYKNIEHIVVDGASKDGTIELIKEYAQKGWVKYMSEHDNGLYEAMNKGACLGKGEYLAFLNSDDFYNDLDGIEKCIEKLVKTNSDFLYAKANIVEKGNKKSFKNHLYVKPTLSAVFTDMPFSHQAMVVKSDVFKKLGMYDLKYKSAADYDFILKMVFNRCSYTTCNSKLATFRIGGFSLENDNLSNNEIADFYIKFYGRFYAFTHEEAKKIYLKKQLPFAVIKNVLPYLTVNNKVKFLARQFKRFLKKIRQSIIQCRFNKNEKMLKLFGIDII